MTFQRAVSCSLLLVVASCGGGSARTNSNSVTPRSTTDYFPLTPSIHVFEGDEFGATRIEKVWISSTTELIAGVECVPIHQEKYTDGALTEQTVEWYRADSQGNVWKFGEVSLELADGNLTRSVDSWRAGQDGADPWIEFPAELKVGDVFSGYRPDGADTFEVLSVTDTVKVPGGEFRQCIRVHENSADPKDADIILYAPGVGRVSEDNVSGRIVLVNRSGN